MKFEYKGRQYETLLASDVVGDGIWLELWDETEEPEHILGVFYSDTDGSFTFHCYGRQQLPLELVERCIHEARDRLLPIADELLDEEYP
ncbi:MAG: hypothetical protein H0T73_12885 [Ardenticatenales bacterium]|nr:hypothetical protein [Ardenticatenales bacterium]